MAEAEPASGSDLAASVVIPAFNAARFIESTLASVLGQTERRIEVLVVDDGSTDGTPALVESVAHRDARVRLLRTPRNGGPAAARNLGFATARGAWIAILDADDTFEPERLERLIAMGEAAGADLCSDNLLNVYEEGERRPEPMLAPELLAGPTRLFLADLFEGELGGSRRRASYGFMQPVFRRAFLENHGLRYDETLRFGEDFTFYVACLTAGASWWVTPEPMYRYLIRSGSLTESQASKDLDRLRRLDRELLADPAVRADARLTRAVRGHARKLDRNFYYRAFTDAVKARRWAAAMAVLTDSVSAVPLIALECLRQTPTIARKALMGGYGRRTPAPAAPAEV
jgi:succinoglycan biosynthesis protein ExoO/succinoglycan biosynthesis protein ExoU